MVTVKSYESPPIDRGEILRYMGCKTDDSETLNLIEKCLEEAKSHLQYKVCYDIFDISFGNKITLACDTSFNCDVRCISDTTGTKPVENTPSSSNNDMSVLLNITESSKCDIAFSSGDNLQGKVQDIASSTIDFGFMKVSSKRLSANLKGCNKALIFAATVGLGLDRLIAKYSRISPVKALCFQAIGAERIESLCNLFNKDLSCEFAEKGLYARPRFSPGYGDFELEAQKEIFKVLDCYRKIGLSLNESLLMSPSKSVTAVIGFSSEKRAVAGSKCETSGASGSKSQVTQCENTGSAGIAREMSSCKTCDKFDCNFRRD